MARWGMVIDLDKCAACQACTIACQIENNIPIANEEDVEKGRAIFWNEVLAKTEGTFPHVRTEYLPRPCMQCDKPPCVDICPTGASKKNEDGITLIDYKACIGCRYCMSACPYGARSFNWTEPDFGEGFIQALNPDPETKPRPIGVVEKCTFCVQRIRKAREKANAEGRKLRDGDVIPACVQTCPAGARVFGDLDDPESEVSKLARSPRAFRLHEEKGTKPKVYYLKEG